MELERKIQGKSFSIKRVAKKIQGRGVLDNQTSSQVNLRVAVSQMNFVVGDFEYNVNRIKNCLKDATKFGADLVLFPELTLTGYPPEDLLLKDDFIAKNKKLLRHLALGVRGVVAVVGYVEKVKRNLYNSAALLYKGKVVGNYRKMILPNYGVFDEKRYFVEGDEPTCFVMNGIKIGLTICEDIWDVNGPGKQICEEGQADVLLNISSSPYFKGKGRSREEMSNRYYFSRKVSEALKEQSDEQAGFAVYLLDLDRFKEVNDGLGHLAGDHVLRVIAARIANACGDQVICARWGGDEFVILERLDATEVSVEEFATQLVEELRKPIDLDSGPVSLGASVGIALCPEHGKTSEQLLEHADIAVYRAKSRKTGVSVYDEKWGHEATERLQLVQALGYAIDHDQIDIAMQPFVSVEDGSLTGFEALARWYDHVRDVAISPGTFIPLAEESGLMPAMGRMILRKACQTLMREVPESDLRVAVNISVMQLRQPDFVDDVVSTLAAANMPANRLELELTESVFAGDVLKIRQVLSTLRNLGVRISIDDFGTGYSSISYLRDFPLDTLKIDQSFVAGLRSGGEGLFSSIVSLAHGLKLSVIVEGVENRHDLDKVLSLGGEEIQGYFFARPIESGKLGEWLEKHSSRPFSMQRRHLSVAVDNHSG